MTLNTSIFIQGKIDPHEVFHFCREMIGCPMNTPFEDEVPKHEGNGVHWLSNPMGIGLNAWLLVQYKLGEAIRPDGDACDEYCFDDYEEDEDHRHQPMHWIDVSFDTTYAFRGENGEGCADLHAKYIVTLGNWLDDQGISWMWQNEFTGEYHRGYDGLRKFMGSGDEANAWFNDVVKPLISEQ